jgi:hypothetical protein
VGAIHAALGWRVNRNVGGKKPELLSPQAHGTHVLAQAHERIAL